MEFLFGYAYILQEINVNNLDQNYQNIKSAYELCLAHEVKFSVHLGLYDSNRSNEWWNDFMKCFENVTISNMIINLKLTTGDLSKELNLFKKNYKQLPQCVKEVLKLENDASNFSVSEVVNISENTGIPVVVNLYNDMRCLSAPLHESINRIIKLLPEYDFNFIVSEFQESINKLHHQEDLLNKRINLIIASNDYKGSIVNIKEFKEREHLKEEFLSMVDSKLRKHEKETWLNPDHDHMEKHLK